MIANIALGFLIIFSIAAAIRAYKNERKIEDQMLFFKRERDHKIDDLWGENLTFTKKLEDLEERIEDRTFTEERMTDRVFNKMIITKVGYSSIPVALTDNEVKVIEKFIDWACLEDDYQIESIDEHSFEEWGGKENKIQ